MHAHNHRAGRFTARLGLESLEGRTLPSATLPTPAPVLAQAAAIQSGSSTATVQSQATTANFSYHLGISPSAVLIGTNSSTGNGHSTGCVMVALYRGRPMSARLGGSALAVPVAMVTSSSSAMPNQPDHYHTTFMISMQIRDAASGVSRTLTFKGTLNGTLSWSKSALNLTFQGPLTRQVWLGKHIYTVTLKTGSLHVPAPGTTPALIGALVSVKNAPPPVVHTA
jgi:hypothetical protein